jgi:hypothetical protein
MSMIQVNLMHIIILGPLFIYIGQSGKQTPECVYAVLAVLTCLIPFIVRIPKDLSSYRSVVNASHYLFQFSALLYVAYLKNRNPDWVYPILKWLGAIVIITHIYLLVSKSNS